MKCNGASHTCPGVRKKIDCSAVYASNGVSMDWHDVTPGNWPLAERHPYVFGHAIASLAVATPAGIRVTGNVLSALVGGVERASELREKVGAAVAEGFEQLKLMDRARELIGAVTITEQLQ